MSFPTTAKKSRRHPHLRPPQMSAGSIVMPGGGTQPLDHFGSSFESARQSRDRSYIFFPNLDSRTEIDSLSRTETMRKARWLYNNDGFTRRVISQYTRLNGDLRPLPKTPDKEWNALAKQVFNDIANSPKRFDRSGKYSFRDMQLALTRSSLKDGDCLVVPTLSDTGSSQFIIYEGHQIGDAPRDQRKQAEESRLSWLDGVGVDEHNRQHAYRLSGGRDPSKSRVIPAGSAHLFTRFERPGQPRGISALAHLVPHAVDVRDISRDMSSGIKSRQLIGFYMAPKDPELPFGATGTGIQNSLSKWRGRSTGDDPDADPNETEQNYSYEEVFTGSNMFRAQNYEPRVLESSQPHENEMAFLDFRVRQMSLGLDMAPELTWKMANLNGNTMRWMMEEMEEVFHYNRLATSRPFCDWVWFEVIGNEIASGRLREPNIPKEKEGIVGWWTCDWIAPRKRSVDRARESKVRMEEHRHMVTTMSALHAEDGNDWPEESKLWCDEIDDLEALMKERKWPDERIEAALSKFLAPPPGTAPTDFSQQPGDSRAERKSEKP